MITHNYQFRVAYPDTDKMGTMHHACYVKYYELARWELLRSIGIPYQFLEARGVMCPVIRMNFKFVKTTHYDELLTVCTTLKSIQGVRMCFEYQLYNEQNELINEALTELAFVGVDDWKPCLPPKILLDKIDNHQHTSVVASL
jgi:acyl-CoA thioester hydrolase